MKLALSLSLVMFATCAASVRAQSPIPTPRPLINPVVLVKLKPLPTRLKQQLQHRIVLSYGVTSFGEAANPIWAVTLMGTKLGLNDTLEFWQQEKSNSFRLLRRVLLPPMQEQHLSTRSLSGNLSEGVKLRWLDPTKRRGPVIIASAANEAVVIYTFAQGWQDKQPIAQKIESLDGAIFNFDSVDSRGILRGETWVSYHRTSQDEPAGDFYGAFWTTGKGWEGSNQKDFYSYLPKLIPR